MILRVATFNLFQFCSYNHSFYSKKDRYKKDEWSIKKSFVKSQIEKMNPDIIGFQEVFSIEELKELCLSIGFIEFKTIDKPVFDEETNCFKTTTVALASRYKIKSCESVFNSNIFARKPIKAIISIKDDLDLVVFVAHLKSNRLNEFEYRFNQFSSLEEKKTKLEFASKNRYSHSLNQRINEAKALHKEIKNIESPTILLCDLNDREFSVTIEALCNQRFYKNFLKKDSFILFDSFNLAPKKIYNPHPEQKEIKRVPTSYFIGHGNTLDFIFLSSFFKNRVKKHIVFDEHLQKNRYGTLLTSDHASVVCEIKI